MLAVMNSSTARFSPNEIKVEHTVHADREFLRFDVPDGWDDVKKVCEKVLRYDGRAFTFSCWNSDSNYCVFSRALAPDAAPKIASFSR